MQSKRGEHRFPNELTFIILAALIVFFAINVSDFELNITFFTEILLYVYIISAGFFFWLWGSLIIPNKR